ncbi:PPK2 family polyphosphate kinase [Paenibacillus sacheonensis]|uniref:Polyphosphate kinase 2 family protein n=1 Tax=Paenibacillus sacheonensis TaxID=742054 RepID=A0A7X5C3U3_9BACL|nr:PPK2 family polyphosphate kinase [Paenibacillus sacheonensis]MBM7568951.1 PPK2 family polyphosphate:nucleotide phosphotransferase [Paenibacillus sacheonensis]NBC72675.1 polyphosphate kinase 2 family protein [Paenibacillus sacheonensis]
MLDKYRLNEKRSMSLADFDPEDTAGIKGKEEIAEAFDELKDKLKEHQEKLYAGKTNGLLILFQGMDCSGKDGVIKKVLAGLNPQGFRAESFKKPTTDESAHDFLWRTHRVAPAKGAIVAFNRSYYEDVLITRVHDLIDGKEASKRLKHISHFEKMLSDSGITIVKIFLHISPEFQLGKIKERMENPEKLWKFDPNDLEERRYWKDYAKAYEQAFKATSTKRSPWYIVPANNRWFRDYLVLRIVESALDGLDLSYPEVDMAPFKAAANMDDAQES